MEHLTDSLSAAVHNTGSSKEFTRDYQRLLSHYGLKGRKIQAGKGHENGDAEKSHHLFKNAVKQSLILRENRNFSNSKENILAFGNPGSGKTHLLCALAQELIRAKGVKVYYSSCSLLVQELLIAKKDLKLAQVLKKLARNELLIIDDIGYVQQNREEMEVLFTLFADRYERGSIMLTSNLAFSKWEKIFKDPMVTAAAIDRLVHHSVILELNILSYRMENAWKKKN